MRSGLKQMCYIEALMVMKPDFLPMIDLWFGDCISSLKSKLDAIRVAP